MWGLFLKTLHIRPVFAYAALFERQLKTFVTDYQTLSIRSPENPDNGTQGLPNCARAARPRGFFTTGYAEGARGSRCESCTVPLLCCSRRAAQPEHRPFRSSRLPRVMAKCLETPPREWGRAAGVRLLALRAAAFHPGMRLFSCALEPSTVRFPALSKLTVRALRICLQAERA